MNDVNKNLGHATAYGYAKSKGYTGTEEEFAELMADYAEVGERAEQAATAAAASATAAEDAAEDAETAVASVAGKTAQIDQNTEDISLLQSDLEAMSTASASDEGKALIAKTVTDGTVTEWEFGEAGGGGSPEIVCNASGAVASFADGADGYAVKGLTVNVEPIQSGSGDPSPDNVRPISGRQSVGVWRSGKNLATLHDLMPVYSASTYGITVTETDGTLAFSGTATASGAKFFGTFPSYANRVFAVKSGITYYISCKLTGNCHIQGNLMFEDGTAPGWIIVKTQVVDGRTYNSFTPQRDGYVAFLPAATLVSGESFSGSISDIMLSTDSSIAYEPYNGQQITVQLGQTVYGGTVDVTTGEMVVDRAIAEYDGSADEEWTRSAGRAGFYIMPVIPTKGQNAWIISNMFAQHTSSTGTGLYTASNGSIIAQNVNSMLPDSSVASWTAYLAEHPLEVCYEIAEPLTVQLVGQSMTTLKGTNNIWSDGGNVSVDYVADTKLFIEQLTEPDADMIADANITSGKYFMVGNTLYLATANIASGAAITPGVNCTRTSLAAALNAINA